MATRTGSRQTGGRQARQAKRSAQLAAPAYITRKIGYYDFLDEDALAAIEAQADWLISEKGIAFRDDPAALTLWREAGADIDGDIVRAPAELVRQLISTAPSEFTQIARNPDRSVRIGGDNVVFAPIYGAPFVRDLEGGRRYGSIADFEKPGEAHLYVAVLASWRVRHLRAV